MTNTCADCKYYQVNPQQLKQGSCRVAPPVSFALPSSKGIMIQAFDPSIGGDRLACKQFEVKIAVSH